MKYVTVKVKAGENRFKMTVEAGEHRHRVTVKAGKSVTE